MTDIAHCPKCGTKPQQVDENVKWSSVYGCDECGFMRRTDDTNDSLAMACEDWDRAVLSELVYQELELWVRAWRLPEETARSEVLNRYIWLGQNPLVLP